MLAGQSKSKVFSAVLAGTVQIVCAVAVAGIFLVMSLTRLVFSIWSASVHSPAATIVAGALFAGMLLACGIRNLTLASRFRKVLAALERSPERISLEELFRSTGVPAEKLADEIQLMIGRGFFPYPVQLDLYGAELRKGNDILSAPTEPDPQTGIYYKEAVKRSKRPYVLCGVTIFACGLMFPFTGVINIICGVAAGVAVLFFSLRGEAPIRHLVQAKAKVAKPKPEPPPTTGDKEVDGALLEARGHLDEMARLGRSIPNIKLEGTVEQLCATGGEILAYVTERPEKLRQIRQFLNYYLPTTVKLLNTYNEFCQQKQRGENIQSSLGKIEGMMQDILKAFHKELDNLYLDQAIDISADISVMQSMLQQEGIAGSASPEAPVLELDFGQKQSPEND